jgi:hypothetical protein
MTQPSIEYPKTPAGIKTGLRAIGYSQYRAARETEQSPALVSMVLAKKAKSRPCLQKLAALIAAKLKEAPERISVSRRPRGQRRADYSTPAPIGA